MAVAGTFSPAQNERYKWALKQPTPYEFAVERTRRYLEMGWHEESLLAQESGEYGRGFWSEQKRGLYTITEWKGKQCRFQYKIRDLIAEAKRRIQHVPSQLDLWEEATA